MSWHCCRARATADYVTRDVIDNDVDLVVHVGDLSYANGDPEVSFDHIIETRCCHCVVFTHLLLKALVCKRASKWLTDCISIMTCLLGMFYIVMVVGSNWTFHSACPPCPVINAKLPTCLWLILLVIIPFVCVACRYGTPSWITLSHTAVVHPTWLA